MTPIFTKLMPRATLPARIRVWTSTRGQGVYVVYKDTLSKIDNHTVAMQKLCLRQHWRDRHFVAGEMPDGYVFVPCDVQGEHTHAKSIEEQVDARLNHAAQVLAQTYPGREFTPQGHAFTEEQNLTLPMNGNGATLPYEEEEEVYVGRIGELAFREALLRVSIPEDAVNTLAALGPLQLNAQYNAGQLRFTSPEIQAAFVKALYAWSELSVQAEAEGRDE